MTRSSRAVISLISFTLIFLSFHRQTTAEEINQFEWLTPYQKNKNYACKFTSHSNGFEVKITRTNQESYWYIQLITDTVIKTQNKPYIIQFRARSDKPFRMFSSIQEHDYTIHLYHDAPFDIVGDDKDHLYELKFEGDPSVNGFLHFKIGQAPVDTVLRIKDISIKCLGKC